MRTIFRHDGFETHLGYFEVTDSQACWLVESFPRACEVLDHILSLWLVAQSTLIFNIDMRMCPSAVQAVDADWSKLGKAI